MHFDYICTGMQITRMGVDPHNIQLRIEGMSCTNCATTVTKSIEQSGGRLVDVNFATGEAHFTLEEPGSLDELKNKIGGLGYKVVETKEVGNEDHSGNMSQLEKRFYISLVFTVPLFSHMLLPFVAFLQDPVVQLVLSLPVVSIGLLHFGKSAFNALKNGTIHMDVLIFTGFCAAFAYSLAGTVLYFGTPEVHNYLFYETAATIITLVLFGNVLEHRSVKQTTTAISELSRIRAKKARKRIESAEGETYIEVACDEIKAGDVLLVNNGDRIPVDGVIIWGESAVDESMITGESMPVDKVVADAVIGGTVLLNGSIKMEATGVGERTVLSRIIDLVKRAQQNKPGIQKLGDRVSAVFVPTVLLISAVTFLLSYFIFDIPAGKALMSAVAVLVISCPCAMGLATPTAVIAGIGRAAKSGILIKGGGTLEEFARIRYMVFDKTGTLTKARFKISSIEVKEGFAMDEIKNIVCSLEQHSSHPIALSIYDQLKDSAQTIELAEVKEEKGIGMSARLNSGEAIRIGSHKILPEPETGVSHSLYVLKNDLLMATIDLDDEIKTNAGEMVHAMKELGIKTILLSGDSSYNCGIVANELGIDEVYSEQMPDQKLEVIAQYAKKGRTAMVGDGINDAPALASASVGISLGNATQVAIESAQVVLLKSKDLLVIEQAYLISKHTYLTIKQNLFWAFAYNIVAIPLAAMGLLNPMVAALAMAFSDVIVIGNSIRLKTKRI